MRSWADPQRIRHQVPYNPQVFYAHRAIAPDHINHHRVHIMKGGFKAPAEWEMWIAPVYPPYPDNTCDLAQFWAASDVVKCTAQFVPLAVVALGRILASRQVARVETVSIQRLCIALAGAALCPLR